MARGECPKNAEEQAGCKYAPACFSDLHHEYWPAADYEGQLEQRWRNLGKNTIQLCRAEHNARHAAEQPPEKPSRAEMCDDLAATDEYVSRPIRYKVARNIARRAIVENVQQITNGGLSTFNAQPET